MVDLMESWMEDENGRWNGFSSWMKKSSNGNKNGEVNRIWIHVCFFKLLDICVTILIMIFKFQ
jgi:hypothetical protein